ncbi:MAG: hypothetical protein KF905_01740 [Flavobacteriales bacterium]|nr:hypothetical protein [Flavobacteriales bacterium]
MDEREARVEGAYAESRQALKFGLATVLALVVLAASFDAGWLPWWRLYIWLLPFPAVLVISVFVMDRNDFLRSGSWRSFGGSAIILFALLIAAGAVLWQWQPTSAGLVLEAGQFEDFNGSSLELWDDGTYRYCDLGIGERCCNGRYVLHGNDLLLESKGNCRAGRLIVSPCTGDSTQRCLHWQDEAAHLPELRIRAISGS